MKICDENRCSGCCACLNICPTGAISMIENEYGSTVPKVDMKRCIACNACIGRCPNNKITEKKRSDYAYAVWSKNDEDIALSSSGGAATVFSRYILKNGGVVFGAAVIDNTVKHIRIDSESEIGKLRGSKYVQSQIGEVYRFVKKEVIDGRFVLFIGTPCQISGLKNYLGKYYANLVTIDLICHGTPPLKYLLEYISSIIGKKSSWSRVTFRGEKDYYLTILNDKQVIYQCKADEDLYFQAFLTGLTYRESCYQCQYACPDRVSDITIGDFWGLDKSKLKHLYTGKVSLVLLNSENGRDFFERCKENFIWERRDISEALNPKQGNLLHPSAKHGDREKFMTCYSKIGFKRAVKQTRIGRQIRNERIKKILRKNNLEFIYHIIRYFK